MQLLPSKSLIRSVIRVLSGRQANDESTAGTRKVNTVEQTSWQSIGTLLWLRCDEHFGDLCKWDGGGGRIGPSNCPLSPAAQHNSPTWLYLFSVAQTLFHRKL